MKPPIDRRRFLQSAVLAAAGSGLARGAAKVPVAGHPWVYAATLPNYDITPMLDTIFADMSYAGLDGIELMHTAVLPDDAVDRIAALSHKHKLPVIGTSYQADMWKSQQHGAIVAEARTVVTRVAKLGGFTLGTSVGNKATRKTREELDVQAAVLRELLAICRENKVTLNLHNHVYEVRDGEWDLNGTLERIPDIKVGPDLNWLVRAGVDPVDFIKRHARAMVFAHLRDEKADHTWPEAMGEGVTDFAAIGRTLHEIGFSGALSIELAHEKGFKTTRPLRESLRASRQFVRRVMQY